MEPNDILCCLPLNPMPGVAIEYPVLYFSTRCCNHTLPLIRRITLSGVQCAWEIRR